MVHEGDINTNGNWYALNGIKRFENELERLEFGEKIETIQTSVSLRSARIFRRVMETRRDL